MAKNTVENYLDKIEKAAYKVRNNMKRADIDFTIQVNRNTTDPGTSRWIVSFTPPANGLSPVVFIALTPESLLEQLEAAKTGINHAAIEKAYHAAQIDACKRTIEGHEDRIKAIDEGVAEEVYYGDDIAKWDGVPLKKEEEQAEAVMEDEAKNEEADSESPVVNKT